MNFLKSISPHAHWLIRIALASIFLYHGLGKFPQAAMMAKMMNMPIFMIYLLSLTLFLNFTEFHFRNLNKNNMTFLRYLISI